MVKLKESLIKEFETFKVVNICCVYCEQKITNFDYVKSIEKYWRIFSMDIDWRTELKIQNKYLICKCKKVIGIEFENIIYYFNKKSTKIIY